MEALPIAALFFLFRSAPDAGSAPNCSPFCEKKGLQSGTLGCIEALPIAFFFFAGKAYASLSACVQESMCA
jgi:hypothetical protein